MFIVNHSLYKTQKSTMSEFNIKIIITAITEYKMQAPFIICSRLIWVRIR